MSSTEQQIDDAVAKRHVQNTDTALGVQSADLDMNLHKIIALEDPTGDKDAANKEYVDVHGGGGYTNLTQFVSQGNWRVFYSNGAGDVTELALGTDGRYLKSNGTSAIPTWDTPAGGGDVVGPGSAINNAIPLYGDTTGKLIKDSTRLIEDTLSDGSNLPDGHAIKVYGDANWDSGGYTNLTQFVSQTNWRLFYSNGAGDVTELVLGTDGQYLKSNGISSIPSWGVPTGGGDVLGPATNTDNYVPQWDGADSKSLKNGFAITAAGKALIDDVDAAAQRTTLGLGTAALRAAEDIMTNGSNLPDGAAIKTYGDTNWGGGSSKWTDAGQYIRPNANANYRVLDTGTNLSTVTFSANTVFVLTPGSTYSIGSTLTISNDYVTVLGHGAKILKTAHCMLKLSGNHCKLIGFEVDGGSCGDDNVYVTGSYNEISGITSHHATHVSHIGIGIALTKEGTPTPSAKYNVVTNCVCHDNHMGIASWKGMYNTISNNYTYNSAADGYTCDGDAATFEYAYGNIYTGNRSYNDASGIGVDSAHYCTFTGNHIKGATTYSGITTWNIEGPCSYCTFVGNTLENNHLYGICLGHGAGGTTAHSKIVGNAYHNNASGDYYVAAGQNNTIIETSSGGSSKWTDEGQYIRPASASDYRILDAGTNLNTVTFSANTVFILAPGATYDINSSLIISNAHVSIIGDGATIRKTAQADGLRITGSYCSVRGVEIDGNSQGWSGVHVTGSHNVIDGVISHNNGANGIGQDGQSTTCQYNRIVNCESFSSGGIGISMNDVDFAVVSNNVSHDNTLEGFTCDSNSPGWASGCIFDGNVAYNNPGGVGGFGIDRARNCVFSNNMIDSSGANDGMKTQNNQGPVEYCIFSGNTLVNNGGYGINITSGTAGVSHHNKLVGNAYHNNASGDYYVAAGQNNTIIETAGGGSSKWTDEGTYYKPNNWDYLRIQDTHVLEIADSASFAAGFPWDDGVSYPGSNKGSMVSLGQTSNSDGNPPLWVQKKFNKSGSGNHHHAGAGHFEVWKQSGSAGSAVSTLTGNINQEAASGDAIGVHGRAKKHAAGNVYAGWFYAYRASGQSSGYCQGLEVNINNQGLTGTFADTVGAAADIGAWIYNQDSSVPSLVALGIGADSPINTFFNGILLNTNAVRTDGVGINMSAVHPQYGIKFTEVQDSHLYCASGNLVFRDTITGIKTLAELASGGGGLNNVVEDTSPELGGNLYCNAYEVVFNNNKALLWKNTGGNNRIGLRLNASNDWEIGIDGHMLVLGYGSTDNNPVMIRINGTNNQQLMRSPDTDSQGRHYVTVP